MLYGLHAQLLQIVCCIQIIHSYLESVIVIIIIVVIIIIIIVIGDACKWPLDVYTFVLQLRLRLEVMLFFSLCLVLLWLVHQSSCGSTEFVALGIMPMQVRTHLKLLLSETSDTAAESCTNRVHHFMSYVSMQCVIFVFEWRALRQAEW